MKFKLADVVPAFATRPINVFSNIASISGLVLLVFAMFKWDSSVIPLLYVCGLSLALIWRYMRQERWARYPEAGTLMERAHRQLKELTEARMFGTMNEEDYLHRLHESLDSFASAFTLVTGSACRATIKEVYAEEVAVPTGRGGTELQNELFVATITRSDPQLSRRVREEKPDRVSANSDFREVLQSLQPFHAGNLPKLWLARKYDNSHWHENLRQSHDFPYRSAIVWPIETERPTTARESSSDDPVIGVLCIDSKRRDAFVPRADIPFGGVFAQSLYTILRYERG